MTGDKVFRPDDRLLRKYRWTAWLVFLLCFMPFAALGFIPDLGWTFVIWYLAGNALWLLVTHLLLTPYYRSISYTLSETEFVERKGIITHVENVVPLRMITNVRAKRGPLDRALGLGTLEIHTAGYSAQTNAEAKMEGLVDYAQMREMLLQRIEAAGRQSERSSVEALPTQETMVRLLTEIRDALREPRDV